MNKELLTPGNVYHFFNRGNNRENIFREERNYPFFIDLMEKYILPISHIYAYSLMKNHFHLLIHLRQEPELTEKQINKPHLPFSNLFNSYAKSCNKAYSRTGSLFEEHPERKRITEESYLKNAIKYIHQNPVEHGFVKNINDYQWSSYLSYKHQSPSIISKDYILDMFGGLDNFVFEHEKV